MGARVSVTSESENAYLVDVRNVCKRFGDRVILDGVSLAVAKGETVALIGPSGGGKSTLLRCINGLVSFQEGEIHVGEHRLMPNAPSADTAEKRAARAIVGMIFQDFQLFPHLSAIANVIEAPVHVRGLSVEEARVIGKKLLERVGLGHRLEAHPQQLSGGEKQRVAIARALAMEPKALLCDEITSALDPELRGEVLDTLEDLKKEGLTLLMVTHEIGFARRAADRVALLAGGKIIEIGTPENVLGAPTHPRTKQFLERVH